MVHKTETKSHPRTPRRSILAIGLLALVYPLLRFIGYEVPRKPRKLEIHKELPANGIMVNSDYILFDRDNKTWAVSRKCTHLGCKINYHENDNILECPCHQSRFTIEGGVTRGPAKENLTIYPVEKRDTSPYYIITT
jgi:Rieske Fe-S protein